MLELRVCIDVDDLERGIAFYTQVLGLKVGRRFGDKGAELLGASAAIDILAKPAASQPSPSASSLRDYRRHWTPIHLDFVVTDVEAAVERAQSHGATLEKAIQELEWGRMALMADPFGHGFCLLQFKGRGYDELAGS
ncbi:VOC family protein [Hyalangium sp.]|uniref:VOC family protein n=1 Tax=Hyalangium sp. TaxID=2028555 RepID=UPI002D48647A|nr:VOC family protein [Hyalangium sp.]HYH95521.1 VOC family protein [Hyalangium sp.]